jgi:hypothetical protein
VKRHQQVKAVQVGLYMVLLGKMLLCVSVLLLLKNLEYASAPGLAYLGLTAGAAVFVGHVLCLLVIPRVKSSPSLVGSFFCNIGGNLAQYHALSAAEPLPFRMVGLVLKWLSFVLFMMFLVRMAKWLDRTDLNWMVTWHRNIFSIGFVLAFLGGPLSFLFMGFRPALLASPIGIFLIFVGLALYVALIASLAWAIGPLAHEIK